MFAGYKSLLGDRRLVRRMNYDATAGATVAAVIREMFFGLPPIGGTGAATESSDVGAGAGALATALAAKVSAKRTFWLNPVLALCSGNSSFATVKHCCHIQTVALRYDKGTLKSPRRLDNQSLRLDARFTRVGVFQYRNFDGSIRRELRLPSEVFDKASIDSFKSIPFTNDHPPVMVSPKNAREYARGTTTDDIAQDSTDPQWMRGDIVVTDADTIAAIESGKTQISNGYNCNLEPKTDKHPEGYDPKWGPYDVIQRQIRGNHVALVDTARAGAGAAIHLDSGDAEQIDGSPVATQTPTVGAKSMVKARIGHVDFEVSESAAQALEAREAEHKARADKASEETKSLASERDKAQAKADAVAAELATVKAAHADATDAANFASAVSARVALCVEAGKHGVAVTDANTDKEIKLAILEKLGHKTDAAKSADYIQARYDLALEAHSKTPGLARISLVVNGNTDGKGAPPDEKASRQAMIDRNRNAYKADAEGKV